MFLLCFFIVKVEFTAVLFCVCMHSAWKDHPKIICTVSGGTLNPTHSLMPTALMQ